MRVCVLSVLVAVLLCILDFLVTCCAALSVVLLSCSLCFLQSCCAVAYALLESMSCVAIVCLRPFGVNCSETFTKSVVFISGVRPDSVESHWLTPNPSPPLHL